MIREMKISEEDLFRKIDTLKIKCFDTEEALKSAEIRIQELNRCNDYANEEIERLNKLLEDIDTYIHLWKLDDIGEKTMLILNDILLIKNGMSDEVVRLKGSDK